MRRAFAAVMTIAAAILALSATPALAAAPNGARATAAVEPMIVRVACQFRDDFARVHNYQGYFCWANAGDTSLYLDNVWDVCAGNNDIYFDWQENPGWATQRMWLNRWQCYDFRPVPGNTTVVFLHIY